MHLSTEDNMDIVRRIFRIFNKIFMVPMIRLGFAPLLGNPITGYIMLIKTIGRKSGITRLTPVNYAIIDGYIYCISGFGRRSHWYLNLQADPRVELVLPGGAFTVKAEEVKEVGEALRAIKQILRNAGFAGFFEGYNPYTSSDEKLMATLDHSPVLRLQPVGIGNGAYDPGGWMWVTTTVLSTIILWLILT
jgi:deazaflavin-dependent oxidoreductase (nitroreductase family)